MGSFLFLSFSVGLRAAIYRSRPIAFLGSGFYVGHGGQDVVEDAVCLSSCSLSYFLSFFCLTFFVQLDFFSSFFSFSFTPYLLSHLTFLLHAFFLPFSPSPSNLSPLPINPPSSPYTPTPFPILQIHTARHSLSTPSAVDHNYA